MQNSKKLIFLKSFYLFLELNKFKPFRKATPYKQHLKIDLIVKKKHCNLKLLHKKNTVVKFIYRKH